MNNQSKRNVGAKFEDIVLSYLQEIDPKARQTKNSGARNNDGDILNKYCVIECKKRNVKNVTIFQKIWRKLNSQILVGSQKFPLLVLSNQDNEIFAVLNFKDFILLVREYVKNA